MISLVVYMKFRYLQKFAIKSPMLPSAARHAIERNVGRINWIKLKFTIEEPYTGKVDGSVFRIHPTSVGREISRMLLISGKIHPLEDGSLVAVRFSLSISAYLYILWLLGVMITTLIVVFHQFQAEEIPIAVLMLPTIVFFFGFILHTGLSSRAEKGKKDLLNYLLGKEVTVVNEYKKEERRIKKEVSTNSYHK